MGRLIVEAVSSEHKFTDLVWHLELFVSVSRAEDGTPVTGLTKDNFRVCAFTGLILEMTVQGGYEAQWEPADAEAAGCYQLSVTYRWEKESTVSAWTKGEYYPFGIQARVFQGKQVTDLGQSVVRIHSLGT